MTQCTRFPVLVHILVGLAVKRGELLNSGTMAKSVDTNPAVIRRLLAALVGAGWVETQAGVHGGARLVADPATITLRDVYRLSEQETSLAMHAPQMRCPIAKSVKVWVMEVIGEAEAALEDVLEQTTIADIAADATVEFEEWISKKR